MKSKNILAALATLAACAALAGCGNTTEKSDVEKAIEDAETLTRDELFKKAAEELGTTGKVKILATSSRGAKAKDLFTAELQKYNSAITDPLTYDTTVDGRIYTTLLAEITTGAKDGYTGALLQDGYQLQTKGLDTGYFKNYVPKEWKENSGTSEERDGNPFSLQYNFKTWMQNVKGIDKANYIDNVWDVTDSSYKGKIDTMNPNNENVNTDWLIQLTSDENEAALKAAYEDKTNSSDVKIADYSKYSKPYAYAFIDRFITNAVFADDDGKAIQHLAQTPGNVGWIVYSKLLKVEETEDISKGNILVGALGMDNTDGATKGDSSMKGFGGFMYKHYLQLMPDCKYPYATCAFFNLISTNADAYKAWGKDVGDYPTMPSINVDRTKEGTKQVDGKNFACLNDPTSDWWLNKGGAIVETPSYIGPNYYTVADYVDTCIANKSKA